MMQINAGDYYQRAPKCCPGRVSQLAATTMTTGNSERSLRISTTIRGAELLCCCCSCSTTTSAKSPGLVASLGVCLLVFGYTLLGAFAFMALEGGFKPTESPSEVTVQSNAVGVVPGSSGKSDPVGSTSVSGGPLGGKVLDANTSSSVSSETTSASSSSILQPSHHEQQLLLEDSSARQMRAYTVERLWSITEDLNVLYKENWTRLAEREVLDLQERMTQRSLDRARTGPAIYGTTAVQRASGPSGRRNHERRLAGEKRSLVKGHRRWTFASSFLYSLTLITTIGYGSTSPHTVWGRLITIVYAVAGIPLMLVYLSTVGDVLARTFRRLYVRACGRVKCGKGRDSQVTNGRQSSSPVPPISGIIGKTSYHRYDNHIETKLASAGHFYSSKSSSCDELGMRSTGSAILLDCGSEGLLDAAASSTVNTFQDVHSGRVSKRQQQQQHQHHHHHHHHHHKHNLNPCSQVSSMGGPAGVYSREPVCLVRIPISLCLVIILLYICCGAIMFNRLEGWSLLESSYFCFTSLGTIGFGDLVPTGGNAPSHIFEELSLCACSLYILAGMGLIAMCFNLMQEEVVRVVRVFGRTCGMSPIPNATAAARIINAPSPGIKQDLNDPERDFVDRDDEYDHEDEAIAMSLVPGS